jgi:hypothetical protein
MDDNAKTSSLQDPVAPTPPPVPAPPSPTQPASQATRPMEPPVAPRHPEQGPAPRMRDVQILPEEAEAASSAQASSDDAPDAPDTATVAEQEVQVKESHPDVEVAKELKDVGVEASDTQRDQLLEERQQMEDAAPQDVASAPAVIPGQTIETLSQMDLAQSEIAAKTEKKPHNAISWIIREVLRWRKQTQTPIAPKEGEVIT